MNNYKVETSNIDVINIHYRALPLTIYLGGTIDVEMTKHELTKSLVFITFAVKGKFKDFEGSVLIPDISDIT